MSLPPSHQSHRSTLPHHVCLLDAYGCLISHDRLADTIIRVPFCSPTGAAALPGLSLRMERPIIAKETSSPVRAEFHKHLSLPFPLPKIEALTAHQDLIALRCLEGAHGWIGVQNESEHLHFHKADLTQTEMFLPLTKEAWRGLSFLFDRTKAKVRAVDDSVLGPARPVAEGEHKITLGDATMSLAGNLAELTQLGRLALGEEAIVTLQQDDNPVYAFSFIVRRIA